ncbi:hypothetical protein MIZ03_3293 [Rhodoferax lithotrophicus]|uniref:Uncharacterized protein n=1 Tax=Rhodoferax lithotrophicus TaxID=2798804 RepID=A0ABM7MPZ0_9BURK|nr:hypothetical protein MIZ03_3293 [Rhodoferax sp. MIZ03]
MQDIYSLTAGDVLISRMYLTTRQAYCGQRLRVFKTLETTIF